eukprot:NODE_21_length_42443_cov_0.822808.p12 type:complete len:314 gc:universal NODE_21_length_42443_cov_0.822808:1689-2630(+)
MQAFGHTNEEIQKAFEADRSQNRPNPIRSTYFLLQEMMEKEKRKSGIAVPNAQSSLSAPEEKKTNQSTSLYAINEDKTTAVKLLAPSNIESSKNNFTSMPQVVVDKGRRASAFDGKVQSTQHQRSATDGPKPHVVAVSTQNLSPDYGPKSAPAQNNSLQVPVSEEKGRRHSANQIDIDSSNKSINEDASIKSLASWFLNNQTTSNKLPVEIIAEAVKVLKESGIHFAIDGYCIECVQDDKLSEQDFQSYQTKDLRRGSIMAIPPQMSKNAVVFRIEVGKVPKINMHGVTFRRISGGVWNYKKICNKIVQQMSL